MGSDSGRLMGEVGRLVGDSERLVVELSAMTMSEGVVGDVSPDSEFCLNFQIPTVWSLQDKNEHIKLY